MENINSKISTAGAIIFFIIACFIGFVFVYEAVSGNSFSYLLTSKSEKCKQEAREEAGRIRDKKLEALKLKANPTPQDIAEIERIETLQKTGLLDREEYEYFYNDCMK